MRKLLLTICLLAPASLLAQRFDSQATTPVTIFGVPGVVSVVPNANVRVCTFQLFPAIPCTPLATTYTDSTLATPCSVNTQIVLANTNSCTSQSDGIGNFGFWATAGNYIYQVSGSGIATRTYFATVPGGSTVSLSGNNTWTGSNTYTQKIISTVATGTAPFQIASTTVVPNLNASLLLGQTWAIPGSIGLTTPNAGAFTTLSAGTTTLGATTLASLILNGSQSVNGITGSTGTKLLAAGTVSGTAAPLCTDANLNATTTGCPGTPVAVQAFSRTTLGANAGITANTLTTVISKNVTMPSAGCPCRAYIAWSLRLTSTSSEIIDADVVDNSSNHMAGVAFNMTGSTSYTGMGASAFSPATYANSASVTFNVEIEDNNNGMTVQAAANFAGFENSWLDVVIMTSN